MQNQFYQTPFQKRSSAETFRGAARKALRERWGLAIGVFLLASLLGLSSFFSMPSIDGEVDSTLTAEQTLAVVKQEYAVIEAKIQDGNFLGAARSLAKLVLGEASAIGLIFGSLTSVALMLFVGGPITVGYHRFLMDYTERQPNVGVKTLFSAFSDKGYWKSVGLHLMVWIICGGIGVLIVAATVGVLILAGFLNSLVVAILSLPVMLAGIAVLIAVGYRYSLSYYIMAQYPDLGVLDALQNSAVLMKGNQMRMFRLHLSFAGWLLLDIFTLGIAAIWISPYMHMANTAFYLEVSGHDTAKEVEFPSLNPEDYFPQI